jgi:hypothetical protein
MPGQRRLLNLFRSDSKDVNGRGKPGHDMDGIALCNDASPPAAKRSLFGGRELATAIW